MSVRHTSMKAPRLGVMALGSLLLWSSAGSAQPLVAPLPADFKTADIKQVEAEMRNPDAVKDAESGAPVAAPKASFRHGVVPAVASVLYSEPSNLQQVSGCSTCNSGSGSPGVFGYSHFHGMPDGLSGIGCDSCGSGGCGENGCVPGRQPCYTCEGCGRMGRIFCAVHNAMCCPDPCYEPHWGCGENASLFVEPARPITQTRIRWDFGNNLILPDRAEYFWKAIGKGGPSKPENNVDYNELRYYQEAGAGAFSFFVDQPYRNLRAQDNLGSGGFGDMVLGTKTLLLDSELVQSTFMLTTSIPMGAASRGIGNGHVVMEPSLLWAIKLYSDTYWQGSFGYVIPIAATKDFGGSVFRWNNSLNHVLFRPLPDVAVVGTIEGTGYTFTSGSYTDPLTGYPFSANETSYFSVGPGFRVCLCDRFDFGFGMQFSVTSEHFADQLYRSEIRFRF